MALVCLGDVQGHLGNIQSATHYVSEGLVLAATMANPFVEAAALCIRGELERGLVKNKGASRPPLLHSTRTIFSAEYLGIHQILSDDL